MTVLELRKLAKESGVKLSAKIDKEGIVNRIADALCAPRDASASPAAPETKEHAQREDTLQAAALSAEVTSVEPRAPAKGWGETDERPSAYRQAWQARIATPVAPKAPLRQPSRTPQQHASGTPSRFGPQATFTQAVVPEAKPEPEHPAGAPEAAQRPSAPQPRLEGYRLGYRAAPQRQDYNRGDYARPGYTRNDYARPDYARQDSYRPQRQEPSYQRAPSYQPAGYQPRPTENYYNNDMLYKPTRDPAFADAMEPPQTLPELLQATETEPASGLLELLPDGYGFLRGKTLLPGRKDVYVSVAQVRRYNLRTGDLIEGKARPQHGVDKFAALLFVEKVNGKEPQENAERLSFEDLTPIYPSKRIVLEGEQDRDNMTVRMIDLIAPIGFGQRVLIVTPPECGKNVLLREISRAIARNDESANVMMLLIDERPEEVTEIRDSVENAEVFATTFADAPENQTRVCETMLERAQRLVEEGKNVVVRLDSLTKLTRAYQASLSQGGRALSNAVTPAALARPKRFFGAARNTREGGSLTLIATIMVDTGSRIDDIIYEEFKGTANCEIHLEAPQQDEPIYPVINLQRTGTRKDDMLLNEQEAEGLRAIRKVLATVTNREALLQLSSMLEKTKCNADLFVRLKDWVVLWEKSGLISRQR